MKHIFLADIHLAAYSNDSLKEGISTKLCNIMNTLNNVLEYARTEKITSIIIAGDIFHTKSIIHTIALKKFIDFIRNSRDLEFTIIDGNHDKSSKSGTGVSALHCIDEEPNVKVLHEVYETDKFFFVPWNPDTMLTEIKKGPKNKFLVAHLGLTEAKLNSGISIISDIGMKDIKKYPLCFLGHYHKPQELGNVIYIGSPIMLDWGERDEVKRFIVFDDETRDILSIPTTGYKKFIEYIIDSTDNIDQLLEQANIEQESGNEVRFIKKEKVDTSKIEDKFKVIDRQETIVANRGINSSMTMAEKLERYIVLKNIPEDKIGLYKEIGIRLTQLKEE